MAAIKGKNTKTTEVALRFALARAGVKGWKLHPIGLPGNPDIFFPKQRLAIFVDGCFWHGCPRCGHIPKTRRAFWQAKILRNSERDRINKRKLQREQIHVVRVWEHQLKMASQIALTVARIVTVLAARRAHH